jgi:hypothetical protein
VENARTNPEKRGNEEAEQMNENEETERERASDGECNRQKQREIKD